MKKICFYINSLGRGGAERVMANLSEHFISKGYDVLFVTSFKLDNEYVLRKEVRRYVLEESNTQQSFFLRNYTRIIGLRSILKKEQPDVLVSFMAEANYRAILASMALPVKTVISVRNVPSIEYKGSVGKMLAKYLLPFADGCVFQTEEAKTWFPLKLRRKSTIILNPVNESFFKIKRNQVPGLIVNIGRLTEQKNQIELIEIFAVVASKYPEAILEIYGEGNLREKLQDTIDSLGLQNKVFLKGNTNDVNSVLKKADIFVLNSKYEGLPNALMESLAVGVPSIASDCPCGGPRELIENNVNGFLVKSGDKSTLIDCIEKLLANTSEKKRISEMAIEHSKKYKPEVVFEEWENYLKSVIMYN